MRSDRDTIRWWPVIALAVLDVLALIWIWNFYDTARQSKVIATILLGMITAFVIGIWFLFLSRFPRKIRLYGVLGLFLLAILAVATLEIRDFSGDIVPKLAWRWSPKHDETLETVTQSTDALSMDVFSYAFPGFLGPNRTPRLDGPALARDWSSQAPREIWRKPIGAGWSGFAIAGHLAVTQEQRGEEEMVTAYHLDTGDLVWAHADPLRFSSSLGGDGPRATPTLINGKVYTFGATGLLNCLDLNTGSKIWSRQVQEEHGGQTPQWGYSGSPLVVNDLVIVSPGGPDGHSLVAYNAESGEPAWNGGNDRPGYSAAIYTELAGVPQIIILNGDTVAAHNPDTGAVLWDVPWGTGAPNCANPLPLPGDRLLVSSGYGVGNVLYKISETDGQLSVTKEYENLNLKAKFANFAHRDGHVYGLDEGVLVSLDVETGKRAWKNGRYRHGQILMVDDLILVQAERGSLHLVEASPEAFTELGEIKVLGGKSWNTMAMAGNRLLMRNHKEAVLLEIPLRN